MEITTLSLQGLQGHLAQLHVLTLIMENTLELETSDFGI